MYDIRFPNVFSLNLNPGWFSLGRLFEYMYSLFISETTTSLYDNFLIHCQVSWVSGLNDEVFFSVEEEENYLKVKKKIIFFMLCV